MHIAFVAISGVRASNTALMEVGLTLPGFVERSQVIASLPSLALLTLAGMTPDTFDVSYHEVPDIHALTELPPMRRRRDLLVHGPDPGRLRAGGPLPGRGRQGRHGRPPRHGAPGRGPRARRCRRDRRGRDRLARGAARPAGGAPAPGLRAGRARVRPCRFADAALRPARDRALQPADRPDPARLPLALRVLRLVHPADAALQGEAGRARAGRDPRDQADLAAPVHRVRGRQQLRQSPPLQGAAAGARAGAHPLVQRVRHLHRRRPGAAGPDARGRLPRAPHRAREPQRGRRRRHRAAPELEADTARRVQGRHRPDPGARHRRQRLLRPGARRRRPRGLRRHRGVRPRERAVRRPDHGHDALPGDAALRAAARGRAGSSRRAPGIAAACSTSTSSPGT